MDYSSINAFMLDEWYLSTEDVHALIVSFSMIDILGAHVEFSQPYDVGSAAGLGLRLGWGCVSSKQSPLNCRSVSSWDLR